MKKIITLIFSLLLALNSLASNNGEYSIQKEHKTFISVMKIIVKNDKIVSISYDRKKLDQKSWVLDSAINQEYKSKYGETFREMKTKLIRAAQTNGDTLPVVNDKDLYNEFKDMLEYLLEKVVNEKAGDYIYPEENKKDK